jgi:ectoine hydroxylase-related dioxygenase (phytanoyl-CoA dioxygenase family)
VVVDTDQYRRDGYLLLAGAVPSDVCSTLADRITDYYERLRIDGTLPREPGVAAGNLNLVAGAAGAPLVAALATAGVPDLVERLTGASLVAAGISGNLNLPGSRRQEFHTDSRRDNAFVIVNVMLVDCGPKNGALELVEGSHAQPLAYHQLQREPWRARRHQLTARKGDVLIRSSILWHRGTTNRSVEPRPMAAQLFKPIGTNGLAPSDGPLSLHGNRYYGRLARVKEALAMRLPALDEALRRILSRLAA